MQREESKNEIFDSMPSWHEGVGRTQVFIVLLDGVTLTLTLCPIQGVQKIRDQVRLKGYWWSKNVRLVFGTKILRNDLLISDYDAIFCSVTCFGRRS